MTYDLRKARRRQLERVRTIELLVTALGVVIVFAVLYWWPPLG